MTLRNFTQAENYLNKYISEGFKYIFQGEKGLYRVKAFLKLLGDPQDKIKTIHVAGTSGKGSTCYLISSLLVSQGFKTGLTLSPHLTNVCERLQINNKAISKREFVSYLNKTIPIIEKFTRSKDHILSYFEILVCLAFYIFADKKVDYAVVETGLGGLYDASNVVSRSDKLSILTKIGLDHTNVLGKTLEKIAFQKAMIINKGSQAISIYQDRKSAQTIEKVAEKMQAKLSFVTKKKFLEESLIQDSSKFNLVGEYQKENASLALEAVRYLSKIDKFTINEEKVKQVFKTAIFPGRFDIRKIANKTIIFDGAHNPQKMEAFIDSLIKKYPNMKFNFLSSFKKGKDYQDMLKIMIPWTKSITITSFHTKNQCVVNFSEKPKIVGQYLKRIGFNNFEAITSLEDAWKIVVKKQEPIVVVGSLYLVGEIFKLIKIK